MAIFFLTSIDSRMHARRIVIVALTIMGSAAEIHASELRSLRFIHQTPAEYPINYYDQKIDPVYLHIDGGWTSSDRKVHLRVSGMKVHQLGKNTGFFTAPYLIWGNFAFRRQRYPDFVDRETCNYLIVFSLDYKFSLWQRDGTYPIDCPRGRFTRDKESHHIK